MSELYEDHFSLVFELVYLMEHIKKMQLIKQQQLTNLNIVQVMD